MKSPIHRHRGGFTLLETLLALMIFSLGAVALVEAINGMGVASVEARRNREVVAKLESLMVEFTRNPPMPLNSANASFDRTITEDGVEFHLQWAPANLTGADGTLLTGLFTVKATARWNDGSQPGQMDAETLVYPPLYAPPP